MPKYEMKFEFFGRNMKYIMEATSREDAINKLKEKVKIHSCAPTVPPTFGTKNPFDGFDSDIFGDIFKTKK